MSSSGLNLQNFQSTLKDSETSEKSSGLDFSEDLNFFENSLHVDIGELKFWVNRIAVIASGTYPEVNIVYFDSEYFDFKHEGYAKYGIFNRLNDYLREEKNRRNFTWAQRLKTCIGVAKGLSYLHSGVGDHGRVIHGDLRSRNVLLNKNLEARICGFNLSVLLRANQPLPEIYRHGHVSEMFSTYIDPVYKESKILNIEADIYSYGILMFEIMSGMDPDYHYKERQMINLVRSFYGDGPEQLIDPFIIDNVDRRSFHMFIEIAYKCISFNKKDRPRMDVIVKTIEEALAINLKISKNSRHVEIGQLYELWQNRTSVIASGNYPEEADQIIPLLYHENIIPFYSEDVYSKYAITGTLFDYLTLTQEKRCPFTWAKRLKTCISVAKGLSYLHTGVGDHGRVIHGNVRNDNVLLNKNLEAKICGLDLSVLLRANQPRPEIYRPLYKQKSGKQRNVRGTVHDNLHIYIDPVYKESKILNIEADIYSYGILMFEILSGMNPKEPKMINLVRRFYGDGPEQLIDPCIIDNVDRRSFHMFIDIAYKCISFNIKDRPRMDMIVKTIEGALAIHNQQAASAIAKWRNPADSLENFRIPPEEIRKATKNFSEEIKIREQDYGYVVYKGHLSDRLQNRTTAIKIYRDFDKPRDDSRFRSVLEIVSMLQHENIAPFIGYCAEDYAIVSEYAINGSLNNYLKDPNKSITWTQRLKICIGVAKGLRYLHSGLGEYQSVLHRDFSSRTILLYDDLEAKIYDFTHSIFFQIYQRDNPLSRPVNYEDYRDPVYHESYIYNKESDVYSYGVVLFEILTGMLAHETRCIGDEEQLNLVALVRRYYADQLDKLLDPRIRDETDARSLYTFKEVAYKCISFNVKDRPSWNKIIKRLEEALYVQNHGAGSNNTTRFRKLEDSFIPLKDIDLAIGVKGPETRIGGGGFGDVYKGQPSERWQNRTVAIKCLSPDSSQGENEFRNELKMIFSFNHENIIPFIGYCDEGDEKVIVYEYASNGSLDCHLNSKKKRGDLTWEHRLKICLGAARGLDYLHSGLGEDNKVIHNDVKSANILLDDYLVAKICDFGVSKSGLVNQPQTQVYTNVAGTDFYMDPIYHEGGILRKESDVYSFGVVMFELLSGMLAYNRRRLEGGNLKPLIHNVRRYYNYKPELLIDPLIREKIDSRSFDIYSKVAFQCISFNSKERPTMETIVDRIEEALEFHVSNQRESQAKDEAELNHPGSLE